jgi:hypothetical protein
MKKVYFPKEARGRAFTYCKLSMSHWISLSFVCSLPLITIALILSVIETGLIGLIPIVLILGFDVFMIYALHSQLLKPAYDCYLKIGESFRDFDTQNHAPNGAAKNLRIFEAWWKGLKLVKPFPIL